MVEYLCVFGIFPMNLLISEIFLQQNVIVKKEIGWLRVVKSQSDINKLNF